MATVISEQVGADADDAFEREGTTVVNITDSILHKSDTGANYRYWGAHRWSSVAIPKGSTITVAYIELYIYSSDDANINIHFEKAASTSTFTTDNADITSRTRTDASVPWVADDLGVNAFKQSDSLITPLQELVNAHTITDLVVICRPNQDANKSFYTRPHEYSDQTYGAKVYIEYTAPAVGQQLFTLINEMGY